MKLIVTAREVMEHGEWDNFCEVTGLDPYCMAEGMDDNEEFTLTITDVIRSGSEHMWPTW